MKNINWISKWRLVPKGSIKDERYWVREYRKEQGIFRVKKYFDGMRVTEGPYVEDLMPV